MSFGAPSPRARRGPSERWSSPRRGRRATTAPAGSSGCASFWARTWAAGRRRPAALTLTLTLTLALGLTLTLSLTLALTLALPRHVKGGKPLNFEDLWKYSIATNSWAEVGLGLARAG